MSFKEQANKIQGLNTGRHSEFIYGLIKWLGCQKAVEVGSYTGKCSVWIAKAVQENGGSEAWLIDDFSLNPETEQALLQNIANCGVAEVCRLVKADSQTLDKFPECDFAFIDGDHSLDGCLADCAKAAYAGARCIVVHDTHSWWGPREFIDILREGKEGWSMDTWDVLEAGHDDGLAVLLRRTVYPDVQYTREKYPRGRI